MDRDSGLNDFHMQVLRRTRFLHHRDGTFIEDERLFG
jgi:hypothetical protein